MPSASRAQGNDGRHDFDFSIGTWKIHVEYLPRGSSKWVALDGIVTCRKVWNGDANLEEVILHPPGGTYKEMALRLYDRDARQWSLYFSRSAEGTIDTPLVGQFAGGVGRFYAQQSIGGEMTFVRHAYSDITPTSFHLEQAWSHDAGKRWTSNFIASLTKLGDNPPAAPQDPPSDEPKDQHAFDWEFGRWGLQMDRLLHPFALNASQAHLTGTMTVSRIWGGAANLAEIEATGPTNHVKFLALRLYLPQTHQWTMRFASDASGDLSPPMFGGFKDGRGEFYDQEVYGGRSVWSRLVLFDVTQNAARDDEALSDDGGKTWLTTFRNVHKRLSDEAATSP